MIHYRHAAGDIVQDSSIKAWRKLQQLKVGRLAGKVGREDRIT